jgi:hypothetical protein
VATGPAPTRVLPPPQPRSGGRLAPTRLLRRGTPPPPPPARTVDPPPKPRRRWWRRKRLLIPLGLLILLALLPDRGDPGASGQGGQPPGQRARPGLGQPVRDGQLEFVVRDVRCGVRSLGSGPFARAPKGQFCLVQVEVENVKQDARTLFEPFQKLHDSAGEKHGAEVAARLYYRDQTLWDQVRPGESVSGAMVFDIPADRRAVAVELHDGIASGGVTVRLP